MGLFFFLRVLAGEFVGLFLLQLLPHRGVIIHTFSSFRMRTILSPIVWVDLSGLICLFSSATPKTKPVPYAEINRKQMSKDFFSRVYFREICDAANRDQVPCKRASPGFPRTKILRANYLNGTSFSLTSSILQQQSSD